MKKQKFNQKRKLWFRALKRVVSPFYKKPTFVYEDGKPMNGSIILSNHEGSYAPMALELYCDFPMRMWGTYEMNSGLKSVYKYLSCIYFHEKKHWNLHLSKFVSIFAAPIVNIFYKGLNLISTYRDARLYNTISESVKAVKENKENIVIFPEKSEHGYFKKLKGFYAGFVVLAQQLFKHGLDVPIYVAYYKKEERKVLFDAPVRFSELKSTFSDKDEITNYLLERCNAIGNPEFAQKASA